MPNPVNEQLRQAMFERNKPEFFDRQLAKRHGIPLAIIIHFLDNILQSDKRRTPPRQPGADPTPWFSGSAEFIRNRLPFLTTIQIRSALERGRTLGFIRAELVPNNARCYRYTLNLPALSKDGWTRNNARSRKYESMCIRPRDARDYGLHAACVIHELEQIQYNAVAAWGRVPARMPGLKQLAMRLPVSPAMISKCLSDLKARGVLVRTPGTTPHRARVCELLEPATRPEEDMASARMEALATHDQATGSFLARTDIAPEWKAHALIDALRLAGKRGFIDQLTMNVVRIRTVCTPADELAATAVFAANPECSAFDIRQVLEACAALTTNRVRKGEFDPLWHVRRAARSLRHLFRCWDEVHSCLIEHGRQCSPPGWQGMPSITELYPLARRRQRLSQSLPAPKNHHDTQLSVAVSCALGAP